MVTSRPLSDLHLECANCGSSFVFTAGEQELYQIRGVERQPARCPACRRSAPLTERSAARER